MISKGSYMLPSFNGIITGLGAMFDLCIVGAGMIGSAAARHASLIPGVKICLVGPSEPQNKASVDHGIFGAHYDEGRITRCSDPDPVWATLAQESIKRYRDIERASGISFYSEVGALMVGKTDTSYITSVFKVGDEQNIPAKRLNSAECMPCVIYRGDGHHSWHKVSPRGEDQGVGFYMLPPIKYPNGRYYIKMGYDHGTALKRLEGPEDVKEWFRHGNHQLAEQTALLVKSLFKGVPMSSWHGDSCVAEETPTNRPYIDMIHAQLGVAIGGNGYAAKSSDEIGRIAAMMLLREWDSPYHMTFFI